MKTIKSMVLISFLAFSPFVYPQKVFKVTDIIDGKTILQHARVIDAEAFSQTSSIFKAGMSEATFVTSLQSGLPSYAGSFKHLYAPYFRYLYSLHKKGMTETRIKETTTGAELAALFTDLQAFRISSPGSIPGGEVEGWKWFRIILYLLFLITPGPELD